MDGAGETQCTHSLVPPLLQDMKNSAPASNLQICEVTNYSVSNMRLMATDLENHPASHSVNILNNHEHLSIQFILKSTSIQSHNMQYI